MLVLSRKAGDGITISGGIHITVTSIGPNRVSIGIEAPPSVEISRDELLPINYDPTAATHQMLTRRVRQQQLENKKLET